MEQTGAGTRVRRPASRVRRGAAVKPFWRESDTLTSGRTTEGRRRHAARLARSMADNVVSGPQGDP